jgi:UDPglucose 6-dehydrogenase
MTASETTLLRPGPGFGGSCFAKDKLAPTKFTIGAKAPIRVVEMLVDVNNKRRLAMASKVVRACGGSIVGGRPPCSGSPQAADRQDNMLDPPSLVIIPELLAAEAQVTAYGPECVEMARPDYAAGVIRKSDKFRASICAGQRNARQAILFMHNIYSIKTTKALGSRKIASGAGSTARAGPVGSHPPR